MTTNVDIQALGTAIAARPWSSLAFAFAAGACLALAEPRGPLRRIAASTIGAVIVAAFRDAATRQLAASAGSWIDARTRPHVQTS